MEPADEVRAFRDEVRFGMLAMVNAAGAPPPTAMWDHPRGRRKGRNLVRDPWASPGADGIGRTRFVHQERVSLRLGIEYIDAHGFWGEG